MADKKALLFDELDNKSVKCRVCNHYCIINNGKRGICGVRENRDGELYSLNYGKTVAVQIDVIEKKPLYHFMPGSKTYSLATVGCNMKCKWCQNHKISQLPKGTKKLRGTEISPEEHIEYALKYDTPSISYTYTEPTIYLEYALDIMKLAKEKGLKNIWVSNGYMSEETLELIIPYLDAVNIDYKGDTEVYKKYCMGNSETILRNIKILKDKGVHVEITSLIIPRVNDQVEDIENIVDNIIKAVGTDTVWHVSRFFPNYKMLLTPSTPIETISNAKKIGLKKGMKHIYLGNV